MDRNRRAVESYWRSGMIDAVTTNEDKVAPVYKLEEICYLLRSSHVSVVKELSDFILKRLDHESPVVKQKVLRLIKYSVGKSGVGFKREMQQNSAAIRQCFHYKGQLDLLKGDALNKAVRDTAQEAISAIFASDNNTPGPVKDISSRIQGFGNKNFEMQAEDKKSFLSEVVGLGSASISHGLSTVAASHSLRDNDNGSYKSPILQESLATELDGSHRYEKEEHGRDGWAFSGFSKNMVVGPWGQDSRESTTEMTNEDSPSGHSREKSREERLLETIVSSGGVRLLPTCDALQNFLMKASKLDAVALSHALESKLQSHLWQVRMKAMCVLESILRKGNSAHSSPVSAYFGANREAVIKCLESPQASLREKANQVLSILDSKQCTGTIGLSGKPSTIKAEIDTVVLIHDMIDTSGPGDHGMEYSSQKQMDLSIANMNMSASPLVYHLFRDSSISGISPSAKKNEEDPFASAVATNSSVQHSIPPGFVFNEALISQPINYSVIGSLLAQQQLLAAMANFQHLGTLGTPGNIGFGPAAGRSVVGGNLSALPDIFPLANNPAQNLGTAINNSKREETKAFDFISDHLSAACCPKRVV